MRFLLAFLALLIALPAFAAERKTTFCTGQEGGAYLIAAQLVAAQTPFAMDIKRTKGSVENIERMMATEANQQCDLAIIQSDVLANYREEHPGTLLKVKSSVKLFPEYVHLICNNAAKINSITDLSPPDRTGHGGTAIAIGEHGGGTALTWDSFTEANKQYGGIYTTPESGEDALSKVMDGSDIQCMLDVSAIGTSFLRKSAGNHGDTVHLAQVDDSSFSKLKDDEKRVVYQSASIPSGTYPEIQHGWFSSAVNTVSVNAIIIARTEWVAKHQSDYNSFIQAAISPQVKARIQARFGK